MIKDRYWKPVPKLSILVASIAAIGVNVPAQTITLGSSGDTYTVMQNWDILSVTGSIASTTSAGILNSSYNINGLANSGSITGKVTGIYNAGIISELTNTGTINHTSQSLTTIYSPSSPSYRFGNFGAGLWNSGIVNSFSNTGNVKSVGTGVVNSYGATIGTLLNSGNMTAALSGVFNTAMIGSLVNSGTISGDIGISNASIISSITNSGTISGDSYGVSNVSKDAMASPVDGTISSIINSGTISGGHSGINNAGTISSIINSGTISGGNFGIYNAGTISTLQNLQGAGNSKNALIYAGALPRNYNIIINSTSVYGKLSATAVTGTTNFGISSLSTTSTTVLNASLSSVLSGITSTNLGIGSATTTSGISNGYSYTLTQTGSGTNIWNLIITACSVCSSSSSSSSSRAMTDIILGLKVGLVNIGATVNPVFAGGTLVLNSGDSSKQTFTVTDLGGTISSSAGYATLSGAIAGSGHLLFNGTGTTILEGSNSYSGGTTISGQSLSISGSSPTGTGDVFVSQSGTLTGTGTIAGNVTVVGTLKPGNSPGYLSVAQNVTLNSGSIYQQDIAGTTQASSSSPVGATGYYAFLNVGGQLVINSGATLSPRLQNLFETTESGYGSAPYRPNLGDAFRIATAAGGISGKFLSITQPAGLASGTQFIAFYNYADNNSLDLAVIPTSYATTLTNSSSNTQSVAGVLDKLSAAQMAGIANGTQANLMYVTATQTSSSLPSFAQALAGEIYGASLVAVPQAALRAQSAVMSRLSDIPVNMTGMNSAPLNPNGITAQNPTGLPTASLSTNPQVNPKQDLMLNHNPSAWGEIAYQYGSRSADSNSSGYNSSLYQAVFGVDIYSESGIKAGAGFALSSTGLSNNNGNGTVGQESVFVYGKMPLLQDYVVDAMASLGVSSTNVTRNDPTSSASLKGKNITGNDVLVSAGISRPLKLKDYDLTITPYARVTWQMVRQSPFEEGTTSAAALSLNGYSANGARGLIGISTGTNAKDPMTETYTYKANLAVGTDTNTLINPTLTANLAGYGTTIQTPNVGNTFVQAGLYGTLKFADNAYAYAGITAEVRSRQTLEAINVGLKIQF